MLTRYGAVGAVKRLLKGTRNDRQVKSFGVEWLVVKKRFQPLSKPDEIKKAKERIARDKAQTA